MLDEEIQLTVVGIVFSLACVYTYFLYFLMRRTFVFPEEPRKSALESLMAPTGNF